MLKVLSRSLTRTTQGRSLVSVHAKCFHSLLSGKEKVEKFEQEAAYVACDAWTLYQIPSFSVPQAIYLTSNRQ